ERLVHRAARDDARRLELDAPALAGADLAAAVDRVAERVDDAADERLADGHLEDPAGAAHEVALAHVRRLAHHGDADVVLFEVQHEPGDLARKLDELAGHHAVEPEDARDAVADREHGSRLGDVDLAVVLADLALQDVGDLTGLDVHRSMSSREAFAQLLELRAKAAVEDQVAAAWDRAAEQRRVDLVSSSSSRPVRAASARRSRSRCAPESGLAETTRARMRPAAASASAA